MAALLGAVKQDVANIREASTSGELASLVATGFGESADPAAVLAGFAKILVAMESAGADDFAMMTDANLERWESDHSESAAVFDTSTGKIYVSSGLMAAIVRSGGDYQYGLMHEYGHKVGMGHKSFDRDIRNGHDGQVLAKINARLGTPAEKSQLLNNPYAYQYMMNAYDRMKSREP